MSKKISISFTIAELDTIRAALSEYLIQTGNNEADQGHPDRAFYAVEKDRAERLKERIERKG